MKICFYWYESPKFNDGFMEPRCIFYENNEEVYINFMHFLTDDEGLGGKYIRQWIENSLNEINKIKLGEESDFNMWGQSLGADISLEKVVIYWGDDRFPEEIIQFSTFYEILIKWLDFISLPAAIDKEEIFFVNA